jgi:para-nitrobenzyl esterase
VRSQRRRRRWRQEGAGGLDHRKIAACSTLLVAAAGVVALLAIPGSDEPPSTSVDEHPCPRGWAGVDCRTAVCAPVDNSTLVRTAAGLVRGVESVTRGTREFYGVPYAQAPIGRRRWQPPEAAGKGWSGVRDATQPRGGCARVGGGGRAGSEDCLYVNIHAPLLPPSCSTDSYGVGLPVLVWFFGGCFTGGSPEEGGHDGSNLVREAAGKAVVVSVSFRLGVFGHLASSGLRTRATDGSAGNWALLDQAEALRWVSSHIGAWGGDPSCITVFGQSSGAAAISAHLVMNHSRSYSQAPPLFHRAIAESVREKFTARTTRD